MELSFLDRLIKSRKSQGNVAPVVLRLPIVGEGELVQDEPKHDDLKEQEEPWLSKSLQLDGRSIDKFVDTPIPGRFDVSKLVWAKKSTPKGGHYFPGRICEIAECAAEPTLTHIPESAHIIEFFNLPKGQARFQAILLKDVKVYNVNTEADEWNAVLLSKLPSV